MDGWVKVHISPTSAFPIAPSDQCIGGPNLAGSKQQGAGAGSPQNRRPRPASSLHVGLNSALAYAGRASLNDVDDDGDHRGGGMVGMQDAGRAEGLFVEVIDVS